MVADDILKYLCFVFFWKKGLTFYGNHRTIRIKCEMSNCLSLKMKKKTTKKQKTKKQTPKTCVSRTFFALIKKSVLTFCVNRQTIRMKCQASFSLENNKKMYLWYFRM